MIEIENELYTAIKNAVPTSVSMSSTYERTPSSFPHIQFWEQSDSINERAIDSGRIENFADKTFEVNIYSNKKAERKAECKKLMDTVDEVLTDKGLVRTFCRPTPNLEDMTVYRITARYNCTVSANKEIFRR